MTDSLKPLPKNLSSWIQELSQNTKKIPDGELRLGNLLKKISDITKEKDSSNCLKLFIKEARLQKESPSKDSQLHQYFTVIKDWDQMAGLPLRTRMAANDMLQKLHPSHKKKSFLCELWTSLDRTFNQVFKTRISREERILLLKELTEETPAQTTSTSVSETAPTPQKPKFSQIATTLLEQFQYVIPSLSITETSLPDNPILSPAPPKPAEEATKSQLIETSSTTMHQPKRTAAQPPPAKKTTTILIEDLQTTSRISTDDKTKIEAISKEHFKEKTIKIIDWRSVKNPTFEIATLLQEPLDCLFSSLGEDSIACATTEKKIIFFIPDSSSSKKFKIMVFDKTNQKWDIAQSFTLTTGGLFLSIDTNDQGGKPTFKRIKDYFQKDIDTIVASMCSSPDTAKEFRDDIHVNPLYNISQFNWNIIDPNFLESFEWQFGEEKPKPLETETHTITSIVLGNFSKLPKETQTAFLIARQKRLEAEFAKIPADTEIPKNLLLHVRNLQFLISQQSLADTINIREIIEKHNLQEKPKDHGSPTIAPPSNPTEKPKKSPSLPTVQATSPPPSVENPQLLPFAKRLATYYCIDKAGVDGTNVTTVWPQSGAKFDPNKIYYRFENGNQSLFLPTDDQNGYTIFFDAKGFFRIGASLQESFSGKNPSLSSAGLTLNTSTQIYTFKELSEWFHISVDTIFGSFISGKTWNQISEMIPSKTSVDPSFLESLNNWLTTNSSPYPDTSYSNLVQIVKDKIDSLPEEQKKVFELARKKRAPPTISPPSQPVQIQNPTPPITSQAPSSEWTLVEKWSDTEHPGRKLFVKTENGVKTYEVKDTNGDICFVQSIIENVRGKYFEGKQGKILIGLRDDGIYATCNDVEKHIPLNEFKTIDQQNWFLIFKSAPWGLSTTKALLFFIKQNYTEEVSALIEHINAIPSAFKNVSVLDFSKRKLEWLLQSEINDLFERSKLILTDEMQQTIHRNQEILMEDSKEIFKALLALKTTNNDKIPICSSPKIALFYKNGIFEIQCENPSWSIVLNILDPKESVFFSQSTAQKTDDRCPTEIMNYILQWTGYVRNQIIDQIKSPISPHLELPQKSSKAPTQPPSQIPPKIPTTLQPLAQPPITPEQIAQLPAVAQSDPCKTIKELFDQITPNFVDHVEASTDGFKIIFAEGKAFVQIKQILTILNIDTTQFIQTTNPITITVPQTHTHNLIETLRTYSIRTTQATPAAAAIQPPVDPLTILRTTFGKDPTSFLRYQSQLSIDTTTGLYTYTISHQLHEKPLEIPFIFSAEGFNPGKTVALWKTKNLNFQLVGAGVYTGDIQIFSFSKMCDLLGVAPDKRYLILRDMLMNKSQEVIAIIGEKVDDLDFQKALQELFQQIPESKTNLTQTLLRTQTAAESSGTSSSQNPNLQKTLTYISSLLSKEIPTFKGSITPISSTPTTPPSLQFSISQISLQDAKTLFQRLGFAVTGSDGSVSLTIPEDLAQEIILDTSPANLAHELKSLDTDPSIRHAQMVLASIKSPTSSTPSKECLLKAHELEAYITAQYAVVLGLQGSQGHLNWHGRASFQRIILQDRRVLHELCDPEVMAYVLTNSSPINDYIRYGLLDNQPSYCISASPSWRRQPAIRTPFLDKSQTIFGFAKLQQQPQFEVPRVVTEGDLQAFRKCLSTFSAWAKSQQPSSTQIELSAQIEKISQKNIPELLEIFSKIQPIEGYGRYFFSTLGFFDKKQELYETCFSYDAIDKYFGNDPERSLGIPYISHGLDAAHLLATLAVEREPDNLPQPLIEGRTRFTKLIQAFKDSTIPEPASELFRARLCQALRQLYTYTWSTSELENPEKKKQQLKSFLEN